VCVCVYTYISRYILPNPPLERTHRHRPFRLDIDHIKEFGGVGPFLVFAAGAHARVALEAPFPWFFCVCVCVCVCV
jgi:hypothetical protein